MFNNFIKSKAPFSSDKASLLEETRRKYEEDLSLIFKSIEQENKEIGKLLEKTNQKNV